MLQTLLNFQVPVQEEETEDLPEQEVPEESLPTEEETTEEPAEEQTGEESNEVIVETAPHSEDVEEQAPVEPEGPPKTSMICHNFYQFCTIFRIFVSQFDIHFVIIDPV